MEDNVVEDANLRNFLKTFLDCVNSGNDIVAIPADEAVSPNKAAGILSMSRTHLYKLLDRGEIPFHRVGRDRRIFLKDINEYVARREGYRKQLAEDFARLDALQAEAIDELAESF
ncbi:hypothetical protein CPHO_03930 [Corynebacterium phocae]|uniref:Helix-turn-helix domain-containing protein n=1 Tax=Corynebacterium phocae TaxID=161895 RepID=A0A1L7D6I8_9CORY|nr:hypothetical protein CPHO_03930 [Corynebacterium phocae]